MSECTDYWCEHYGKASGQCDRCDRKDGVEEKHDLGMVLKKRTDRLVELNMDSNKNKGIQR
jgi:hypothetical protein